MTCPSCGADAQAGQRFCGECGTPLETRCPSCGTPNPPSHKFCGECGSPLQAKPPAGSAPAPPQAERRLVSVLFADLVGFTAASADRDPEETRELLSAYFERTRTLIERYGGTVEKFIGDAVMAVWGAPVAQEDDAERAVRAALELVAAVPELHPALQARAGVLTGEAAVTLGAAGQGMVAGDLVNTASRVQAAAEPGAVLVGEATRRASEAAIAYEDAGAHELKGKTEPVPLWRALRVVASRGGEGRSAGLEAPFVGRDAELRTVKELFHAAAEDRRARLLSVVGVAGVGKSRLSWEFEKYLDGLADLVWWHRGRCLSYGDGVAYWALAEMVRGRIGVLETDDQATTAARLRATLEEHFADAEERAWVEQRLSHLVGLSDRAAADREDLFPAWRRFFERLAEQAPVVLVFEDLHWADAGLVAFVEHLLDWSRNQPVFVLTLSRPEIVERHPGFPGATRSATTLPLEPLGDQAMDELLRGLVPGLPEEVRARIRERADGIPLYAVETVRMLLDRGLLERAGSEYRLTGDVDALDVPETLQALIASRLDALPEPERAVLQNAAVLGKTFTAHGLAALAGRSEADVEPLATSLVRKELLYLETDPRSAERGQYGFLQSLVQRVAYETLSRRERRARHIAVAEYLARESGMDPSEIAELIAAHYLDAYEADPNGDDAAEIKAAARTWFVRAAERALTLAAPAEAQRAFARAASLTEDDAERARLLYEAGDAGWRAGNTAEAERALVEASELYTRAQRPYEEAQASSKLAALLYFYGRIEEAVARLERSLAVFGESGDEAATATVCVELGRLLYFEGDEEQALAYTERALELGERLRLPAVVSQGLNTKALLLRNRPYESIALMRGALALAREYDLGDAVKRGFINLGYVLWVTGAPSHEIEAVTREGLAYARRRGDRAFELNFVAQLVGGLYTDGRWDEIEQLAAEVPEEMVRVGDAVAFQLPAMLALIALNRGDPGPVEELVGDWARSDPSADFQVEGSRRFALALVAAAEGRHEDALTAAAEQLRTSMGPASIESNLELGAEAAARLGRADALAELLQLADKPEVPVPLSLRALRDSLSARLGAMRGDDEPPFGQAVALLRETGTRFWLGTALVEHAEWLVGRGRAPEAEAALEEARQILNPLGARPWLDRIAGVQEALAHAEPGVVA
ncbi:MAG TPA: adenylate/guanylate cyclase domain-containing protein [Gaiellaceae bacterium]|nr:adenylate/guanylate cyclase domain-containing protein [Gaiellaceae bacterium]